MQLYVVWEDGAGHRYLIKKEIYPSFEKAFERIEDSYDEHRDEDIYYEELNDVLSHFAHTTLEGEEYYVVLPEDIK